MNSISEYERERLKRIEKNKNLVKSIVQDAEALAQVSAPAPRPKKPRVLAVKQEVSRRSSRVAERPAVKYVDDFHIDFGERKAVRREKGERKFKKKVERPPREGAGRAQDLETLVLLDDDAYDHRGGWKPSDGIVGKPAQDAANAAAIAALAKIPIPDDANEVKGRKIHIACVKAMSASQVSGGCWMQLPGGFCHNWPHVVGDLPMLLLHDGETYPVVYLRRVCKQTGLAEGGAGLSGGWAGFAKAQKLSPEDSVLFKKVEDTVEAGHLVSTLEVTLFRARDYVGAAPAAVVAEGGAAKKQPAKNAAKHAGKKRTAEAAEEAPARSRRAKKAKQEEEDVEDEQEEEGEADEPAAAKPLKRAKKTMKIGGKEEGAIEEEEEKEEEEEEDVAAAADDDAKPAKRGGKRAASNARAKDDVAAKGKKKNAKPSAPAAAARVNKRAAKKG